MSAELTHYFPATRSREIRECIAAGGVALVAEANSDEVGAHIQLTFSNGCQFYSHGMDGARRRSQVMDEITGILKLLGVPAKQISPGEDQDFWQGWIDCARKQKTETHQDDGSLSPADVRRFNEVALPDLESKLIDASGKAPAKSTLYALRDTLAEVFGDIRLISENAQSIIGSARGKTSDVVEWPDLSPYGMALRIVRLNTGSHYLAVSNGDRQPDALRKLGYAPIPNNKRGVWFKSNVNVSREAFEAHLPQTIYTPVDLDSVIVRPASTGADQTRTEAA